MSEKETKPVSCVGIIMDGNRRWAKERGFPSLEGHRKGYGKLKDVLEWCKEENIQHLVVYAFSTENWGRSEEEVSYLMDLFREMSKELKKTNEGDTAVHFVGDLSRFPKDLQEKIEELHKSSKSDATYHLWIAASYGGRPELISAVNTLAQKGPGPYTEKDVTEALWTHPMPDPDLIIRTGGDHRISNFLLWQGAYAELFFIDTYWPAFSREDFEGVLNEYHERERRYGK
jgi:undecaprenyl diphosphate synthase